MKQAVGKKLWSLLLSGLFLLTGCALSQDDPAVSLYAPHDAQRLVVYTSHKEEVYQPIIEEFEARTGIWVELVPGGTNELLERLVEESDSPRADVMFGGGVDSLQAYGDCFTPYFWTGLCWIPPCALKTDSGPPFPPFPWL